MDIRDALNDAYLAQFYDAGTMARAAGILGDVHRLEVVHEAAAAADGWTLAESPEATSAQLEAVHSERYVRAIHEACMSGGRALDPDTIVSEGTWEAALHAAGVGLYEAA